MLIRSASSAQLGPTCETRARGYETKRNTGVVHTVDRFENGGTFSGAKIK